MISPHLNKNNLHHAYLIEGTRDEIVPEIIKFLKDLGVNTLGNPDFCQITIDNFKIDEAFDLRAMSANKSFSSNKKIFLICVNSLSLDAQNVLLKMFEEPIKDTHFFLVVPDANALLKTLVSRFYLISSSLGVEEETKEAEKFITLTPTKRIEFIKELLAETEEEDSKGNEIAVLDSARSKALKFLNALESVMSKTVFDKDMSRTVLDTTVLDTRASFFQHLFKVREFLRMPGSSTKSLLESVALIIPDFRN